MNIYQKIYSPNYINNVYKFSDELLSMYKFWENFEKIYTQILENIKILKKKVWKNIYYKISKKNFGKKNF